MTGQGSVTAIYKSDYVHVQSSAEDALNHSCKWSLLASLPERFCQSLLALNNKSAVRMALAIGLSESSCQSLE
eukprot:scaffold1829_cov194-Ochromonas_danica.AAC.34